MVNSELIKELEELRVPYRLLESKGFSGRGWSLPEAWKFVLSAERSLRVEGALL